MSKKTKGARKNGRPSKTEPPRVPYQELDRLLVYGEEVTTADGERKTTQYPSHRELAERYGVCCSVISRYATKYSCKRRRAKAQALVAIEADKKLVELRSTAVALTLDDELRIIDSYLAGFEQAMAEKRMSYNNPSDFNTMVRLKRFIQGGADSRQEIHATMSLEDLQSRHRKMMKTVEAASSAQRGKMDDQMVNAPAFGVLQGAASSSSSQDDRPPESASTSENEKVSTAHFFDEKKSSPMTFSHGENLDNGPPKETRTIETQDVDLGQNTEKKTSQDVGPGGQN